MDAAQELRDRFNQVSELYAKKFPTQNKTNALANVVIDKSKLKKLIEECPEHDWNKIVEAFCNYDYEQLGFFIHGRMTEMARRHVDQSVSNHG